ncbi:MAG TPA: helix-turn-helix transcriptional regulator [Gammaproteobacteria bacterium]|jgi:AraC-like DNA-binding protein|nr:helix-turn-helix transcriptional regulator [Gammaproteobacteria bacterium]
MALTSHTLYASPLVTVRDVVCTEACGPGRHEESCPVASLALVRSGTFVRRDRMGRHVADATRVVFFDPSEPYMVDHPVPGGDRCTALMFDPRTLREAVRHARGEPERLFTRATLAGSAAMHLAHRELLAAARDGDAVRVEETALYLLRQSCGSDAGERVRGAAANRAAALATDTQVLIGGMFSTRVTLKLLADKLGVSSFRLCRAFRQATGGTLHQYLTDLRLAAALERLPEYRERLTDLALDLGFSSHSHFSHAFRGHFGRSPRALLQDL